MKTAKKYVLPLFYGILMLRPIFLGGTLWSDYSDAYNVLPVIEEASAAVKSAKTLPKIDQKKFEVWVTAYSSTPEETDDSPTVTATNKTVRDGFIAANFLPFGTKVKIPGFFGDKIFTVEDRMHRRKDDFMDVWMPSKLDAVKFGIHRAEVIVIEMGDTPNPLPAPVIAKSNAEKNPAD